MSRGGRGDFPSGGNFGRGVGGGMSGPFGHDSDNPPDYSTTELFPPQTKARSKPLSVEERHIVARYLLYRDEIHNGSPRTVMGKKRGMEDPFNDVSKYSAKYKRQKRWVSELDSRPYVKGFFLEEVWDILGTDGDGDAEDGRGKEGVKAKKLIFSALDVIGGLDEEDGEDREGDGREAGGKGKKGVLQRLLGGDVRGNDDDDDDEVAEEEEEAKGNFVDDEEGDYNAEVYINDGEDEGEHNSGDEGGVENYYQTDEPCNYEKCPRFLCSIDIYFNHSF